MLIQSKSVFAKRTIFVLLGVLVWQISSANENTKEYCAVTQKEMKKMQEQLPTHVDFSSSLIGVNAIFISNECHKNYNYVINTKKFVEEVVKHSELTYSQAHSWLQTQDGRDQLMELMSENVAQFVQLRFSGGKIERLRESKIKEKTIFTYSFDDPLIPPVEIVAIDTTR